jgi:PKD domain
MRLLAGHLVLLSSVVVMTPACRKATDSTSAGPTTPTSPTTQNRAPSVGATSFSPTGTGMAAATVYTFSSAGTQDPDGDSLSYAWTFGDGQNGTGASPTHTYQTAGTYTVGLTVSDGTLTTTAGTASVAIGPSLANPRWVADAIVSQSCVGFAGCAAVPNVPNLPKEVLKLSQSGTTITGSVRRYSTCSGGAVGVDVPLRGTISALTYPATLNVVVDAGQCYDGVSFSLQTDSNGAVLDGTAIMVGLVPCAQQPVNSLSQFCRDPVAGPIKFQRCGAISSLIFVCDALP